ncbi:MAG: glycerophosphodiester phosphodiesterase [Plesiomonas sp.]
MKKTLLALMTGTLLATPLFALAENAAPSDKTEGKIVVAHRGASGYLPEHTLPAKAMAYAMGADYLEQDVVMTKDNQLIVLHDHYLDRVTDVAKKFPDRARKDGRFYAIDFTLPEIRQLSFTEEFVLDKDGKMSQKFPNRFPMWASNFRIHTLAEEIEMIQGMNHSTGNNVGIYVETKAPWFHKTEGKDISVAVLETLKKYGYTQKGDKVFFQSFDAPDLQRVHDELLPKMGMDIKLVQLITPTDDQETMVINPDGSLTNYSYDWMFKPGAMAKIAKYADGVGPWYPMVVEESSTPGNIKTTIMVKEAHENGLVVHPYTFRKDPGKVPAYAKDLNDMLDIFYNTADVDGVFTDFPDVAVKFLQNQKAAK